MTDHTASRPDADAAHGHPSLLGSWREKPLSLFGLIEDLAHYAISLMLAGVAAYVLYHTAIQVTRNGLTYAERTTDGINGILLVIILIEILDTVIAHFEHTGFQLKPFLIIGIISGVRHILTIGAQLSVATQTGAEFWHTQVELGVSAGVSIVLVLALIMVRRTDRPGEAD
jgi:uncharacterized membrane protein (DUF373 family)